MLKTIGEPTRIADRVGYFTSAFGYASMTASSTGVLVYGPSVALTTQLRWLDRTGMSAGASSAPAMYNSPRLSPDQKSVAFAFSDSATPERDIWVMDVARGTTSRATFDPSADWFPAWTPDGGVIFFGSTRPGATSIFRKVGAAQDELFYTDGASRATYPNDVSNDGRLLLFTNSGPRGYDLGVLPLAGDRKAAAFLATPFNEAQGRFSPDTRWVAYASDESGRFEIYVRPYPARDQQWRVSVAGGSQPEWRRDGKELFYISADRKMMAVPTAIDGETFTSGTPRVLFDVDIPEGSAPYPTDYAVSADGQRFLVNTVVEQTSRPTLTAVLNWTAELGK
jgi:Tol biopolymer transport system component